MVSSNVVKPFIINGRPLKSINQYYNKEKARLQAHLKGNKKTSKRIKSITNIRNNKVKDYLHKSSRKIVNFLVSNDISTLVIGYNEEWKQNINLGKLINADLNGSLNILKKVVGEFEYPIEVCSTPLRVTI